MPHVMGSIVSDSCRNEEREDASCVGNFANVDIENHTVVFADACEPAINQTLSS